MANILVLNAGSGSQKVALYAINSNSNAPSAPVWQAEINSTTPGQPEGYFVAQITSIRGKEEMRVPRDSPLPEKLETLIRASWEGQFAALETRDQIDLVGHRVVHGGLEFSRATLVNPQVESTIERLGELAPLHNPHSLVGISACREILGSKVPQFADFDTAFIARCPRLRLLMPDLLTGLRKDSSDTDSMGPAFGTPAKERLRLSVARVTRISVKSSAIWEAGVLWPQCAEPDA